MDDDRRRYASFDTPLVAALEAVARLNPSNLQVAADGAAPIDDQDYVGTFDPQGAAAVARTGPPAQLVTGSKANPPFPRFYQLDPARLATPWIAVAVAAR